MAKENGNDGQYQQPPPGYPSAEHGQKNKCCSCFTHKKKGSKKKGDRGFIEGCLFALCCCWLCEECCLL